MEIRPIDANALQELCNRGIQNMWNTGVAPVSWAAAYAVFKNDIDSIPTLTPQNEWVSVEERLPENGQIVLFHQKDGFIYCAEYFAGNALMSPGWFIDNDCWDAKEVTHWMPLPAPPKKEHNHE